MKFGVLGPLTIDDGGVSVLPTAPKQRQLVSLLLVNANRFVSMDVIMEEIWAGDPPRTVVPTVQTYVLQIRRALAAAPSVGSMAAAHQVLATGNRGYVLAVPPEELDLTHFESLVVAGREAARRGDDLEVSLTLRRALELFRGPALDDVDAGPRLRAEIDRLQERRMSALEQCLEAELALGYHHDVLSELAAVAAEHPLNENLQALHMLALYRCGRQVRALEVYRALRRRVVDELGIEPSIPLRRLHEAILNADPGLDIEVGVGDHRVATMPGATARCVAPGPRLVHAGGGPG